MGTFIFLLKQLTEQTRVPSKGRLLGEQMYAALQTVNLWSPNPIQYNLVSYKSPEESTTNCSAAAGRGALLPSHGSASPALPKAGRSPISPRHLHSPCSSSSSWNPTRSPHGRPRAPTPAGKVLGAPGVSGLCSH